MTPEKRVAELRAEYAALHHEVLAAGRRADLDERLTERLQTREQAIVRELRSLGAEPYDRPTPIEERRR